MRRGALAVQLQPLHRQHPTISVPVPVPGHRRIVAQFPLPATTRTYRTAPHRTELRTVPCPTPAYTPSTASPPPPRTASSRLRTQQSAAAAVLATEPPPGAALRPHAPQPHNHSHRHPHARALTLPVLPRCPPLSPVPPRLPLPPPPPPPRRIAVATSMRALLVFRWR